MRSWNTSSRLFICSLLLFLLLLESLLGRGSLLFLYIVDRWDGALRLSKLAIVCRGLTNIIQGVLDFDNTYRGLELAINELASLHSTISEFKLSNADTKVIVAPYAFIALGCIFRDPCAGTMALLSQ